MGSYTVQEGGNRVTGMGEGVEITVPDSERMRGGIPGGTDAAIVEFSQGSLRAITNQFGVQKPFIVDKRVSVLSSDFPYPESLRTTKHPVQNFWVYDGAHATLGAQGKISTSRDQIMPNRRIQEQDAVEWQRVGSKKGWMFNGPPQQNKPGFSGENVPTHTNDGFVSTIRDRRWFPTPREAEKQELATRTMPKIDIENNARGIGVTGPGSGQGGMSGGYKEINKERYMQLPIPMAKYNWTGSRLQGTGREDQGGGNLGSGAGGYRAGYQSKYPVRPSFPMRRSVGLTRTSGGAV